MTYSSFWKRAFDVLVSAGAIVVLAPLLAGVALAILMEDGGPVLFRQSRVARSGGRFTIFKFRSMAVNSQELPSDRAGSLRVTTVGRMLRRTNIDELPQLFNILRGDMSLVGPRPALPQQVELCRLRDAACASRCRPGLTGLAQVNGYDGMPVKVKATWDNRYAERITWRRDIEIVLRTFVYLLQPPPTY
jgi:lipopolysaccharide/colanic/teichoic acid biosynthesis glycosyltransferase